MQTIAFVSRKDGTGKSTLAIGLGVAATEAGHKVVFLRPTRSAPFEMASSPGLGGAVG
jgi:hypothetical protein